MNFKFLSNWCKNWQKNVKTDEIILKIHNIYLKNLNIFLNKLNEYQVKKNELKDLEINIEFHYKKRSLDQNALMWWLYNVIENETGTKANDIYKDDMYELAPRSEITIKPEMLNYYKSKYRFIISVNPIGQNGNIEKYQIIVIESSSHWNIRQMAEHINFLIIRLVEIGISDENQAKIFDKINQWQNYLNDQKVILFYNVNEDEYRKLHVFCEACLYEYIGNGTGQLAHIKSKGAGGIDETYNRLHLCHNCHIKTQHQKGWNNFIKLFPHLKYKILTALKGK